MKGTILMHIGLPDQAKFDMDTRNDSVKRACTQMMKNALRQQRYRLKKRWFDPYPLHLVRKTSPVKSMTHEQWNDLVESWKDPKKMAACEKNKANRAKVKFHQTTGSRSYVVHLDTLGDKYNNEVPNGLDYFKECHYSNKKKGYTPSVQSAITEMENMISEPTEGEEQPKSANEVVADYLAEHTKQPKFLQNVGIQIVQSRSSVKNVEAQLAAEKMANADLRSLVTTQRYQIEVLTEQLQEEKQARVRDKEEMQKKQAETDAKLDLLLSRYPTS
ncbi:hypothetical protein EJB05_34756 [Eragrostis curvula]|uniref:Uncharacterized protein n=1 Tax=Eragrostis curvula TaxID=38414 RepID=A0A5J9U5A1_9POAL|nr:hypothetical protein EJB05_34756 [Eragrostis curvula]